METDIGVTAIEVRIAPIELPCGPRETMARLRAGGRHALLESAMTMDGLAAWSYIAGPALAALYTDAAGTHLERAGRIEAHWSDPFDALRTAWPTTPVSVIQDGAPPDGLDFIGGWIGVLGYDIARHLHRLPTDALAEPVLPQMRWTAVDQVLAFHHPSQRWWHCTVTGPSAAWPWSDADRSAVWDDTLARARVSQAATSHWQSGPLIRQMDQPVFEAGVRTILETIAAGGALQVNLTRREDARFTGDPWALYAQLAAANPAPFCAFIEADDFAIASCSPERFLRLSGRAIQARPIKGTIERGATPEADATQRAWLAASAKNRAENLMIVDLMRNDIGRVAETGSVTVPDLFALEAHASVWQMVSTIQGRLRADLDAVDLLRACWPPGSMTGAPKLAAMLAIEALEPTRRGFYAGSIGHLDCRGGFDLSVVIRSAVVADRRVTVQLGGGIVADSNPASEWQETAAKGARLLGVLETGGTPIRGAPA